MGAATRPWKSMPNSMSLPKASRMSAMRPTARSSARAVQHAQFFGAVHLEGVDAGFAQLADGGDDITRTVAADPAVHLHLVAHPPAQQVVDRHAEGLALDVPQGLVDAGDGAHQDRAAAIKAAAVHGLPQVVDAARVLADQEWRHLVDGRFDRARAPFDHRFAPADDAFVGLDLEQHPARRNPVRAQFDDVHCLPIGQELVKNWSRIGQELVRSDRQSTPARHPPKYEYL